MKSAKDSDARLRLKAKRRRSAEVSLGREIGKIHHRLDRIDEAAKSITITRTLGSELFVDFVPAPMSTLMAFEADRLSVGERTLTKNVRAIVSRDSRIHLAGPNGSGKSTLLSRLVAGANMDASRLLYLPQELDEGAIRALLEEVQSLSPGARGRRMKIVATLGVDPEALLRSEAPSPGEARKLALARGLAQQVWALVLDEPTNHLDIPAIERLEEALCAYPGALLIVSHDEAFCRRLTLSRWQLGPEAFAVHGTD